MSELVTVLGKETYSVLQKSAFDHTELVNAYPPIGVTDAKTSKYYIVSVGSLFVRVVFAIPYATTMKTDTSQKARIVMFKGNNAMLKADIKFAESSVRAFSQQIAPALVYLLCQMLVPWNTYENMYFEWSEKARLSGMIIGSAETTSVPLEVLQFGGSV